MSTPPAHQPSYACRVSLRAAEGFHVYARPSALPVILDLEPQLASWEHKGHPSQQRISAFLTHLRAVGAPQRDAVSGPLALSLEIGLPSSIDLLHQRDLDNYLQRVGQEYASEGLVSAWASKRHARRSAFALASATPLTGDELAGWSFASARPLGSSQHVGWRRQIAAEIATQAEPAPEGPLELHVAFRVDAVARAWTNLWKPAIDALTPVLGEEPGSHRLEPRDGRITMLGLHLNAAPGTGWAVELGYWWRPANSD